MPHKFRYIFLRYAEQNTFAGVMMAKRVEVKPLNYAVFFAKLIPVVADINRLARAYSAVFRC